MAFYWLVLKGSGNRTDNKLTKEKDETKVKEPIHVPGNPPSAFRSHKVTVVGSAYLSSNVPPPVVELDSGDLGTWTRSIVKTPPVVGTRATSPRDVEKVDSSSCPNYDLNC